MVLVLVSLIHMVPFEILISHLLILYARQTSCRFRIKIQAIIYKMVESTIRIFESVTIIGL